jgi:hypothetical protein
LARPPAGKKDNTFFQPGSGVSCAVPGKPPRQALQASEGLLLRVEVGIGPTQLLFSFAADKEIAAGRNPSTDPRANGTGPFNIYLRSPQYAELSRPLGDYLRFKAPMPRKFKEIAIMLTSRYWGGQYVWYSHRQQALDAGLSPTFITAMAAGMRNPASSRAAPA